MPAPPFKPPMMKHPPGTSGPAVREWQRQLRERGWNIVADGHYGPISKRICTNFQREHELAVDGIVGPNTWKAAWEAPATMPPHAPDVILHFGSTGEHVLAWERQVDSRGWRIAAVDGAFDAATETACKALQEFKGLPVTGRVDYDTWCAAWREKVPVAAS
ncbi:peptidoglycan-binding protein [Spirillospora sp. NPDC029432]|uniref:peptidoglycan-binding domain-containing protein n=1 Tax=Spirillospora sp. NPDC029432 TaxID=3154599 RepID=UPI0034550888